MRLGRRASIGVAISLAVLGWILSALVPEETVFYHLAPEHLEPSLPLVSAPFRPGSDVVSVVPWLFGAIAVAVVATFLVELGKVALLVAGVRSIGAFMLLGLLQLSIGLDVLRRLATDWYGYALHFLRLASLSHEVRFPDPLPIPAPYFSLIVLVAASAILFGLARREMPRDL